MRECIQIKTKVFEHIYSFGCIKAKEELPNMKDIAFKSFNHLVLAWTFQYLYSSYWKQDSKSISVPRAFIKASGLLHVDYERN